MLFFFILLFKFGYSAMTDGLYYIFQLPLLSPQGRIPRRGKRSIENRGLALLNFHRLFRPLSSMTLALVGYREHTKHHNSLNS
jgi:hypothetical protein